MDNAVSRSLEGESQRIAACSQKLGRERCPAGARVSWALKNRGNGCLARHERSAGSGAKLVQLAESVLDSCRCDSFVTARATLMRRLGRRRHVVLTMRHGSDYP